MATSQFGGVGERSRHSTYLKALEVHKRRLDDYEHVHFRKTLSLQNENSDVRKLPHSEVCVSSRQPVLEPHVQQFSKATAKPYLKRTESQWMLPALDRHGAAKMLLERPAGSFVVRDSTHANHALSIRLNSIDPPITHFLINISKEGFYHIQGSNLQFVTLYDLLAYFCFFQSGGMPCLLRPPKIRPNSTKCSDSEDDEEDEHSDEEGSELRSIHLYDEISINRLQQTTYRQNNEVPPPLPPRPHLPLPERRSQFDFLRVFLHQEHEDRQLSESVLLTKHQHDELRAVVDRVSPLIDSDPNVLLSSLTRTVKNRASETAFPEKNVLSGLEIDANGTNVQCKPPYKNVVILENLEQESDPFPPLPPKPCPPPLPPRDPGFPQSDTSSRPPPLPPRPAPPPVPPKPFSYQTQKLKRSASDSSILSCMSEDTEVNSTSVTFKSPQSPTSTMVADVIKMKAALEVTRPSEPKQPSVFHTPSKNQARRLKTPSWAKKLKWSRKPRSRVKHYILRLAEDTGQEFGSRIHYFIETTLMRISEPHQKLLSDVRQFMIKMRELLLNQYRADLLSVGMDSCRNFEHLLEATIQQCIVKPLSQFIYVRLEEHFSRSGSLQQVQAATDQARMKSPADLGIRSHLVVPSDKPMAEIASVFDQLKNTYCAMRKMEYLLEAVRLTYENVKDVNNPKKSMNDLGADDFLPLFVWVLAQNQFVTAEIEAEYVWGLAHPTLFNGEGGYYLTTLTSAVNVLKELCGNTVNTHSPLPSMTHLQTELEVYFEETTSKELCNSHLLPVLPTMTAAEICEMVAQKCKIKSPERYALYAVEDNHASKLADDDCPQELRNRWELETSNRKNKRIIAYLTHR